MKISFTLNLKTKDIQAFCFLMLISQLCKLFPGSSLATTKIVNLMSFFLYFFRNYYITCISLTILIILWSSLLFTIIYYYFFFLFGIILLEADAKRRTQCEYCKGKCPCNTPLPKGKKNTVFSLCKIIMKLFKNFLKINMVINVQLPLHF